jgi:hypothetical protein
MFRLAVVVVLGTTGVARAKPCPVYAPTPVVLTPQDAELPAGSGIVIGWRAMSEGTRIPFDPDPATWTFTDGKPGGRAQRTEVAPDLAVFRDGEASTLVDGKGTSIVKVKRSAAAWAALPAPAIASLTRAASNAGRRPWVSVQALVKTRPAGAVAVVIFDPQGKPRAWSSIEPDGGIAVFHRGSCNPYGTYDPPVGTKLSLAYLDAGGKLGAKTAATVAMAKP